MRVILIAGAMALLFSLFGTPLLIRFEADDDLMRVHAYGCEVGYTKQTDMSV